MNEIQITTPIRKVTSFQTDDGRRVDMIETVGRVAQSHVDRTTICGQMSVSIPTTPELETSYEGVDVITIGQRYTVVRFDLPATSLQEAFELYDARIEGIINAYNAEQQKKIAVVPAGAMDIIDANKPIDPRLII